MAYTVKKGDSWWSIAERELGDGRRFKELAAANGVKNPKKSVIKPGQALKLPGEKDVPPNPRPRPADRGPFMGGHGEAPPPRRQDPLMPMVAVGEAGDSASKGASATVRMKPTVAEKPQTHAQEREYDPNVLLSAAMNRKAEADPDLGAQPGTEPQGGISAEPSAPSEPQPFDVNNFLRTLSGLPQLTPDEQQSSDLRGVAIRSMAGPAAQNGADVQVQPGSTEGMTPMGDVMDLIFDPQHGALGWPQRAMGRALAPPDQSEVKQPEAYLGVRGDAAPIEGTEAATNLAGGPAGDQVDPWAEFAPAAPAAQAADPWAEFAPTAPAESPAQGFGDQQYPTTEDPDMAALKARAATDNMPFDQRLARSAKIASQSALRGVADLAGAAVDVPPAIANLTVGGLNKVGGMVGLPEVPLPFSPDSPLGVDQPHLGDFIADQYSGMGEDIGNLLGIEGAAPIPQEEMSPGEQFASKVVRFGSGAAMGGAALPKTAAVAIPRAERPIASVMRDFGTGAGAATGQEVASGYTDDPVWQALASILGAIAGKDVAAGFTGTKRLLQGGYEKFSRDRNVPMDPETGREYSKAESSLAAKAMQAAPVDRQAALTAIKENTAGLSKEGVPATAQPTAGLASEDPGLIALERKFRLTDSPPFIQRDQGVKDYAADQVGGLRDDAADIGAANRRAGQHREQELAPTGQAVDRAQADVERMDAITQQEGAALGANRGRKGAASEALDRPVVGGMRAAQDEKNRLFREIDPNREVDVNIQPLAAVVDDIRQGHGALSDPGAIPNALMQRIDRVMAPADEGGFDGVMPYRDVEALRTDLASQIAQARKNANYALADNLSRIRNTIGRITEDMAANGDEAGQRAQAALGNYADNFAPIYNRGPGDEATKFRKDYNLDRAERTTTPPSKTAPRFLGSPEKAASLNRVLDSLGGPGTQEGRAAVRDYLMADLAEGAIGPDGTVNAAKVDAWIRKNGDVIQQFPGLDGEFANVARRARTSGDAGRAVANDLAQARERANAAAAEFDATDVGKLAGGEHPSRVAEGVLGDPYGGTDRMAKVADVMSADPEARRGFKAATTDVLKRKVTGTKPAGEGEYEVSFAGLAKQFKDNEEALAKVYSPEEMNTLRRVHKLLGYFKGAESRATTGSQTAENMLMMSAGDQMLAGPVGKSFELAAKHFYGNLEGGGIARRFKLMVGLLPSSRYAAREIVHQAWFNPELAAYLLGKPVRNFKALPTTNGLRAAITADIQANKKKGEE